MLKAFLQLFWNPLARLIESTAMPALPSTSSIPNSYIAGNSSSPLALLPAPVAAQFQAHDFVNLATFGVGL